MNRLAISKAVYNTFQDRQEKALLAIYLFGLYPDALTYKPFKVKVENRMDRTMVIFYVNEKERLCPISDEWEALMLREFVSGGEGAVEILNTRKTISRKSYSWNH